MKLRNVRRVGRFSKPDGSEVTVYKGTQEGRGIDRYYYNYRYIRQWIAENELRDTWKRVTE